MRAVVVEACDVHETFRACNLEMHGVERPFLADGGTRGVNQWFDGRLAHEPDGAQATAFLAKRLDVFARDDAGAHVFGLRERFQYLVERWMPKCTMSAAQNLESR